MLPSAVGPLTTALALTTVLAMENFHFPDGAEPAKRLGPIAIIAREGWGAEPPKATAPMTNPVPFVIIHHSEQPAACFTAASCKVAMRTMQRYHQTHRGWDDIGYSFALGSDGEVYEGRGWSTVGSHALGYNNRSVGICVIGDWNNAIPAESVLETLEELIAVGVAQGYISQDYVLWGHHRPAGIQTPARSLFDALARFENFDPTYPHSVHSRT